MTNLPSNSPLRSGIGVSSSSQFLGAVSRSGVSGIYSASSNPNAVIKNRVSQSLVNDSSQYTFPLDLPPIHMNIIETDWKVSSKTLTPRKFFRLPLPLQLKDAFDVQYDTNFSLNPAATLAEGAGAQGIASATVGRIVNSFKSVTLSQPNFRRHQFAWKLAPKNFEESERIQRILFHLRKGMTPKRELAKFVMRFPFIYLCHFAPNPKFLYKLKPCVLERIDVDYNGGNPSPAFYKSQGGPGDQAPESVAVTLTFLELEYWLDADNPEQSDYKMDVDTGLPTNNADDVYNYYEVNPDGGSPDEVTSSNLDGINSSARTIIDTISNSQRIFQSGTGIGQ